MRRTPLRVTRTWLLATGMLLSAALAAAGFFFAYAGAPTEDTGPVATDLNGKQVVLEEPVPEGAVIDPSHSTVPAGESFTVPSVDLHTPLEAMNEVDGQVTPPGFRSAFVVQNMSAPLAEAANGVVVVVMHSLRGGGVGPGNYLFDVESSSATVSTGDEITVADLSYSIESVEMIEKSDLPARSEVWSSEPGSLIVITCLQTADGKPSQHNLVIKAQLTQ